MGVLKKIPLKVSLSQAALLLMMALVVVFYLLHTDPGNSENRKVVHPGFGILRPPGEVYAMALQGDFIWAGGVDGLYMIDAVSRRVVLSPDKNAGLKYVRALLVDSGGVLWVGHDRGISRYKDGVWDTLTKDDGLPDNRVISLMQDGNGRVWAGTWYGAAVFGRGNGKPVIYTVKAGLSDNMVNVMLADSRGGLWFGSYNTQTGGLSYLSPGGQWSYFSTNNGLLHNYVTSLFEDDGGNIWAGTGFFDTGGVSVFVFRGNTWSVDRSMTKKDGLAGEKVRSVFQDKSGRMWLGSEYDGITVLEKGKREIFTVEDGLSGNEVKSMLQDRQGNIWLGTGNGITVIDASALEGR